MVNEEGLRIQNHIFASQGQHLADPGPCGQENVDGFKQIGGPATAFVVGAVLPSFDPAAQALHVSNAEGTDIALGLADAGNFTNGVAGNGVLADCQREHAGEENFGVPGRGGVVQSDPLQVFQ